MGNLSIGCGPEAGVINEGDDLTIEIGFADQNVFLDTPWPLLSPRLAQDVAQQIDALQIIIASRRRCQASIAACQSRIGTQISAGFKKNDSLNPHQATAAACHVQLSIGFISIASTVQQDPVEGLQTRNNIARISKHAIVNGGSRDTYYTLSEDSCQNSSVDGRHQKPDTQPDKSALHQKRGSQANGGERKGNLNNQFGRERWRSPIFVRGCLCTLAEEDVHMNAEDAQLHADPWDQQHFECF